MLCKVCIGILRGGRGEMWAGTHDLTFEHHKTTTSLRHSRESDCAICIALANVLRKEMDLLEDQPISIQASLRELSNDQFGKRRYCLDFELEKRYSRIFLLKETDPENRQLRTPRSLDTSSDEVFEVAQSWTKQCKCAEFWDEPGDKWYPKRLLDLEEVRSANGLKDIDGLTLLSDNGDIERTKVRLIEPSETFSQKTRDSHTVLMLRSKKTDRSKVILREKENNRYVTLSHCWGKPKSVQGQLKLSNNTEARFKKEGIELRELPKSFRDAILFASRLERVGFIWIDSLCIKQPIASLNQPTEGSMDDWLEQSREMDKIYRQSFLNISATAAVDGDRGLFSGRRPEYLWEDEINVNYTGTNLFGSTRTGITTKDQLTRCTLVDVSFWDELVEHAPVNCRGWVLQERLMAPRVLHFCHNQVAWECAEFEDAEGHPEMNLTLRARSGYIVDEGRLKNLTPAAGRELRNNRLKGFPDPDKDLPDLYMYELWKRIVEVYSRLQLSVSRDKLIALSGIARRFCHQLFTVDNRYVAGLWMNNLESQLLWQVREVFKDGVFENPARRDATRAPSFSWASIDTPHGIIYPDVTDFGAGRVGKKRTRDQDHVEDSDPKEELLLQVIDHRIIHADPQNPFGLVMEARLFLRPRYLRRIQLRRLEPPLRVPFSWRLVPSDLDTKSIDHSNLYLDAPESDSDIFQESARLYCMPVAYGERTVRQSCRYLYCLLLKDEGRFEYNLTRERESSQLESTKYQMFRRIGITKLSNHADEKGQKALKEEEFLDPICLC